MDYEFRHNGLTDGVVAFFSMEHQALGRWFTEELAGNKQKLLEIELAIQAVQSGKQAEWMLVGGEMTLTLSNEQVVVFDNCINFSLDETFEEDMNFYDAESIAKCGLEDFEEALASYHSFLLKR
ncbi:MAG: YacL family protein [Parashewanella sp.]